MTKNWFVYVLVSEKSSKFYIGMTQDVEKRLSEHNAGKSKFTKGHLPWRLVMVVAAGSTDEARKTEKYYKSSAGRRKIRKMVESKENQ